MTIKRIERNACESCSIAASGECPVVESCPTDVIRLDEQRLPYIAYPDDCMSCFLCQLDCPQGTVEVSAVVPMPFLPSY